MTLGEFVQQNFIWILTAAFGGGGFYFLTRSLMRRFDDHERRMNECFDKLDAKDASHDRDITDLKIRVATLEERTNVLEEMRKQIADIWKQVMRQSQAKE